MSSTFVPWQALNLRLQRSSLFSVLVDVRIRLGRRYKSLVSSRYTFSQHAIHNRRGLMGNFDFAAPLYEFPSMFRFEVFEPGSSIYARDQPCGFFGICAVSGEGRG